MTKKMDPSLKSLTKMHKHIHKPKPNAISFTFIHPFFCFFQTSPSFTIPPSNPIPTRQLLFPLSQYSIRNRQIPPSMNESETYPKEYYNDRSRADGIRTSSALSSSSTTSVHVTALDGLVNVNSLFTIAVFVGLSLTTPGQHSLQNSSVCDAGIDVARKLLVFEVVSFSFFLFSSLVAQGLKLAINLLNSKDVDEAFRAHINLKVLRLGMLASAVGSVMGCLFLMLSMVNVIQIRLGMLSCGSKSAVHAVAALLVLLHVFLRCPLLVSLDLHCTLFELISAAQC
ncbi:uncharacterized protein LOC111488123 isoform X2 [Cucurbita maxima]|uniref:Uncharacterized protein LOC111488123 isoform X2 n=1 Tax=Cucurbita maxima TaxID=3661 RepID=A0A6J1JR13_CUCMA|nr:uncharacterized protein LOC111488123 isoform X2 [Cucurbita maxima]